MCLLPFAGLPNNNSLPTTPPHNHALARPSATAVDMRTELRQPTRGRHKPTRPQWGTPPPPYWIYHNPHPHALRRPRVRAQLIRTTIAGGLRAGRLPTTEHPCLRQVSQTTAAQCFAQPAHPQNSRQKRLRDERCRRDTRHHARTPPRHDNAEPLRPDAEQSHPSQGDTYATNANDPVGNGTRAHPADDAE